MAVSARSSHPGLPVHARRRAVRRFVRSGDWWRHLLLITVSFLLFFPFIVTVIISTKNLNQFNESPIAPTFPLHWENYATAAQTIWHYLLNSIIVSGTTCVGVLCIASLTAYVFARF